MKVLARFWLLGVFLSHFSCTKKTPLNTASLGQQTDSSFVLFNPVYNIEDLIESTLYDTSITIGDVPYALEASGIEKSHVNNSYIWVHNDGSHPRQLFLIDANTGDSVFTFSLSGVLNIDWEDMTLFDNGASSFLYIADVGDNFRIRPDYSLFKLQEPKYNGASTPVSVFNVQEIKFTYPDGDSHNCEAIMVDPLTGDIIIATKKANNTEIYKLPVEDLDKGIPIKAVKMGKLPLGNVTAGDISDNGERIVLRNYSHILFWQRQNGESLSKTFARIPQTLPYDNNEIQGEAFCWVPTGYYTLSEGTPGNIPDLYFYPKK